MTLRVMWHKNRNISVEASLKSILLRYIWKNWNSFLTSQSGMSEKSDHLHTDILWVERPAKFREILTIGFLSYRVYKWLAEADGGLRRPKPIYPPTLSIYIDN